MSFALYFIIKKGHKQLFIEVIYVLISSKYMFYINSILLSILNEKCLISYLFVYRLSQMLLLNRNKNIFERILEK